MRKNLSVKTFILSMIGLLLVSLAFLGGIYFILNQDPTKKDWTVNGPVTSEPISFDLEINNPDDNLLVFDKSIVVSGKTSPHATVILSSNDANMGLEADAKGAFSTVIDLSTGINTINVTAFDSNGNQKDQQRIVYYSEEKL